ncbi:MAG: FAD-dependent thymidylate synthase, partial [Peptococcaceae bacterium]|nr:FAD-dependent thymidylate synthase [Peptococcaceae bacterium]
MQLTNYEGADLLFVEALLKQHPDTNRDTLLELLKTCNLSFVLEGINRWQSTMICERKDSYVQQSQRYVTMSRDGYTLPELGEADRAKAEALIAKVFALYEEMSQLKEAFKGRPKREHYRYGIPVEDARYILPLAVKTNLSVATTG